MASVTFEIDLPLGITITSYERHGDGHGLFVSWPLPDRCTCERCKHEGPAYLEWKDRVQVVRDLDVLGQPCFWIYQTGFHRCPRCHHRQHLIPPFKRKEVSYTLRFEEHVLNMMVGSNESEVARRLGISAETVARIVNYQLTGAKSIDPQRVIKDVGIDEISLKKRHKLYATVLTDWTDPDHPTILAVVKGKDEAAGRACLEKLSEEQRQQVTTYRADLGLALDNACQALLPNAQGVADRFHVTKLFNEAIDAERKKITRAYKAKLTKAQRKEFRSLMWEFRRNPATLTATDRQKLDRLFEQLPALQPLYELRVRFQAIFDADLTPRQAASRLTVLLLQALDVAPDLEKFVLTYETWREEILEYFRDRKTSGGVEGINNKARVAIKRAYGLKSADSLWTRLILDLHHARDLALRTIRQVHDLVLGFRAVFSTACT